MNEINNTSDGNLQETDIKQELIFEENGTYCRIGSVEYGTLEVDLQSSKQRGKEVRCISFSTLSYDPKEEKIVQSEMFIMDEAHFNNFKAFIAKLNWND